MNAFSLVSLLLAVYSKKNTSDMNGAAAWKTLQMQCFDISLKLLLSILILLPKDCLSRSGKVNRVQQLDTSWIQISVLTICHTNLT